MNTYFKTQRSNFNFKTQRFNFTARFQIVKIHYKPTLGSHDIIITKNYFAILF